MRREWRVRFDNVPFDETTEQWFADRDAAVDAAIANFLQTGQWGDLSRDDQPALFYRLWWMGQLFGLLHQGDTVQKQTVPYPTEDLDSVWKWAQETWRGLGR